MSVTASSATPELAVPAPAPAQEPQPGPVEVSFDAAPDCYRHWRLRFDGDVAWLLLDVDEQGGIVPGYELKLNSYDLGVDIELYDAVQRLRFSHPEVRSVVLTSGKDKTFCAGANIRMLAQSSHPWKVNFCKFTNETRNGIEDATENSGQTYIAAINGTAAGGGYELALACDEIVLADDGSSAVALPELPLPGGIVTITVFGPHGDVPESLERIHALGAAFWPLAMTRELDDLILRLRANELELGIWVIKTKGEIDGALAFERIIAEHSGTDWFVNEIRYYFKRVLKRLDVTSRSLIALIEPGSCFAGALLELALACDRQYMLDGSLEDSEFSEEGDPAPILLTESNFGAFPMGNGLTRLESRFYGNEAHVARLRDELNRPLLAAEALELGLVTFAPDDIDWADEVRIALEERASFSPDALTGMEANHRFVGPETMETKIFGRLTAWQN